MLSSHTPTTVLFNEGLRGLPVNDDFKKLIDFIARSGVQFSVVHSTQEDNLSLLKDMSVQIADVMEQLVWAAGGDAGYIQPWRDSMPDDLDIAFSDTWEARGAKAMRAAFVRTQGLSTGGLL
jgi:hypothetical protein